jgi:hypothetical protein
VHTTRAKPGVVLAVALWGCAATEPAPRIGSGSAVDGGADLAPPSGDLLPPPVCLAGQYLGTYEVKVLLAGLAPIDTKGSVDLTLTQSQAGEFLLEIRDGHLMGKASGNDYSADLVGTLNCTTLKLENGTLKNGKVTVSGLAYGFEGPLTADYDPKTVALVNGTWNVIQTSGPMILAPSKGNGTWTATHM